MVEIKALRNDLPTKSREEWKGERETDILGRKTSVSASKSKAKAKSSSQEIILTDKNIHYA